MCPNPSISDISCPLRNWIGRILLPAILTAEMRCTCVILHSFCVIPVVLDSSRKLLQAGWGRLSRSVRSAWHHSLLSAALQIVRTTREVQARSKGLNFADESETYLDVPQRMPQQSTYLPSAAG